ncbi:hydroxyisourate hydrolase [Commensalibacter sp. TBRC 16381]|uniref:5-hydroxyisourate hydrolase n=2 Tax=Commensalibacter oyaizuii TaxID=3043873 RepID=A0ABT6PYN0_9PROT|nr:hydroxyisourate hydrolase [Commensalibacter sp. TBRC 16381]MDI2089972.1 hydroxyisourate hydrolase [Commensalibacter sp. TBRC 16381]
MTTISTHILDMVSGKPAPLVLINLFHGQKMIFEGKTDHDGRCRVAGLKEPLVSGSYQFAFHMAEYFKKQGYVLTDPPFLDVIRIDFGVAKDIEHYHVPLLVSPYGFSTYRGS